MPKYAGKGSLNSIADRTTANELAKLWSVVELMTGQIGNSTERGVTLAELNKLRSDLLTKIGATKIPGFRQDFVGGGDPVVAAPSTGGGGAIFFGPDPPGDPAAYLAWWNTEEGALKLYYADANTTQWVDAMPARTGAGGVNGGAPTDASYLTLATHANLTAERVLTAGTGIDLDDAGAGGALTISVVGGNVPAWVSESPLTPLASPDPLDEEWNDGTDMSGDVNGLDASWSTFGASQTRDYEAGSLILTGTSSGSANATGLAKSQPSTPYTVTARVNTAIYSNYNYVGLGLRNATSGKFAILMLGRSTVAYMFDLYHAKYTSPTAYSSYVGSIITGPHPTLWLRVFNDGTNMVTSYSFTGLEGTFVQVASEALATHFSGGNVPDQFCITVDAYGSSTPVGVFGPIRVS